MALNKNIKLILNYAAGPLLLIFLFYSVSQQLQRQTGWKASVQQIMNAFSGGRQWRLYLMMALMWLNWGLEAAKWQVSILPLQQLGFLRAFKAVLAGACIASFTPNRVGEYFGRMLYMAEGKKVQSVAPAIVCSMGQMLVTLLAGSAGLFLFLVFTPAYPVVWISPPYTRIFLLIAVLSALVLATLYFRVGPLVSLINRIFKKYVKSFSIPQHFSNRMLFKILLLSLLRYGVFLLQYFLLFSLFRLNISVLHVFMGVSVMFVVMAVIPSFTILTDLALRWEAGIRIFQVYTLNTAGILAVSLGIWIVNLIIPALIGSLLILRIKLFSSK
ncbi:MAG TPA: hypothetical protein VGM24_08460 [Puia sp.]